MTLHKLPKREKWPPDEATRRRMVQALEDGIAQRDICDRFEVTADQIATLRLELGLPVRRIRRAL